MPTWEEVTPFTERAPRARLSARLLLVAAQIAAFAASGILVGPAAVGDDFWKVFGLTRDAVDRLWLWQFITYPLAFDVGGGSLLALILALYLLWVMGRFIEEEFGPRRLVLLYLGGALYGGAAHLLYIAIAGVPAVALGNEFAPVVGILVYAAAVWPHRTMLFFFLIPMRLLWVAALVVAISLFYAVLHFLQGTASVAFLGATLFALAWWKLAPAADRLLAAWRDRAARRHAHEKYELRRRVDAILDKIQIEGIGSLTRKERDILDRASRTLQDRRVRYE